MTLEMKPDAELRRRQITLAVAATALVGGLGCATLAATNGPMMKVTKVTEGEVVLTDTLLAMGALDAELSAAQGQSRGVVFLGKAHSYVLTSGSDKLLQLAQRVDGSRVTILPFTAGGDLDQDSSRLDLADGTFWGNLRLRYEPRPANATEAERMQDYALLSSLGFDPSNGRGWIIKIWVHGVVRPAIALPPAMPTLRRTHEIVFRAPPEVERRPDLARVARVPVAVAVDLLATPLYLGGLAIFGLEKIGH